MKRVVYISVVLAVMTAIFWTGERGCRQTIAARFSVVENRQQEKNVQEIEKNKKNESEEASEKLKKQKLVELEQLLSDARNSPVEVYGDIVFNLLESNMVVSIQRRRELLEQLFELSSSAKYKVKKKDTNDDTGTRSWQLSYGLSLNLDALSIQCRVVKKMLALDKARARQLFETVEIPDLKPIPCEDSLVYDVTIYYDTLRDIVKSNQSGDALKRQEDLALISQVVEKIQTPTELSLMMKVAASLDLSTYELPGLLHLLGKKMETLSTDNRSFMWSLRSLNTDFKSLAAYSKEKGETLDDLLSSYRSYLAVNMQKKRCGDYGGIAKLTETAKKTSDSFNQLITDFYGADSVKIPVLQANSLMPKELDRPPTIYPYWKTATGEKQLKGIQHLNYGDGKNKLSVADKDSYVWQNEMANYYSSLKSWSKSWSNDEKLSDMDFFHQKCSLLALLLQIVPKSNAIFPSVLADYVNLLEQSNYQKEHTAEWLWEAKVAFLIMDNNKQSADSIQTQYLESANDTLRAIARTRVLIAKYKQSPSSEKKND
jgi:uncharacterized membrane protein